MKLFSCADWKSARRTAGETPALHLERGDPSGLFVPAIRNRLVTYFDRILWMAYANRFGASGSQFSSREGSRASSSIR